MPLFINDAGTIVIPDMPGDTDLPVYDTASNYSLSQNDIKITRWIDGSPWFTTFYTQYIGESDPIINSGDINDPTIKQYAKIEGFELRVTQPLAQTQNDSLNKYVLSGGANVYPVITPITGDVFIAKIENGIVGIFEITNAPQRLSPFKTSAWAITYSLIEYVT